MDIADGSEGWVLTCFGRMFGLLRWDEAALHDDESN